MKSAQAHEGAPKLALSRHEAANALGCSTATIDRLTKRGLLRACRAAQRLMRAMRRHLRSKTGRKRRGHPLAAFCFCDADFWKDRLDKLLAQEPE